MQPERADYDAIIVGASFAGLAVASKIRGRTLIIDKRPIGTFQTSACGSMEYIVAALGCADSIVNVHHTVSLHTRFANLEFRVPRAYCLFHYGRFCQGLLRCTDAKVVMARVLGMEQNRIYTSEGAFTGRCLVDCSGWRAVLGSSLDSSLVDNSRLTFGMETPAPLKMQGLHFWFYPELLGRGFFWTFPGDGVVGLGAGSYTGDTGLMKPLQSFASRFNLTVGRLHGGYFPWQLRRGTVGHVFLVGDAAGQCLPLTGEGIRPATFFGHLCGSIVQDVIDGRLSLEEGLQRYERAVDKAKPMWRLLIGLQNTLPGLPSLWVSAVFGLLGWGPLGDRLIRYYCGPTRNWRLE